MIIKEFKHDRYKEYLEITQYKYWQPEMKPFSEIERKKVKNILIESVENN